MENGLTVFALRSEAGGMFDGSNQGVGIAKAVNAIALDENSVQLQGGFVEVARNKNLDALQSFTIEVTIQPTQVGPDRRNILEAQTPGVALFLSPEGKVVGSVATAAGWLGLDSGATVVRVGQKASITFRRDAAGKTEIEIDGRVAATKVIAGPIISVGAAGFKAGAWVDGVKWQFAGKIENLQIRHGAVDAAFFTNLAAQERLLETKFAAAGPMKRVVVSLKPDESIARLQPIKDIMNAAGVSALSDLQTMKLTTRTVMSRGKVLVAPRASTGAVVNWSAVAKNLATATTVELKRTALAQHLTNRNSVPVIRKAITPAGIAVGAAAGAGAVAGAGTVTGAGAVTGAAGAVTGAGGAVTRPIGVALRATAIPRTPPVRFENNRFVINPDILKDVASAEPARWIPLGVQTHTIMEIKTIPIGSAVLIAKELDLTNTELVIEPDVTTFYLIAEKVICGANAKITWRRPGGSTPGRQNNPDLNGRGWSGIHTNGNNRHGLNGEDGRAGESGIDGAAGRAAPHLEMWVKDLSALPNLDLNGEDGIIGGAGQRGGTGGNGANGEGGKWAWFFGKHCVSDPGDGGHGGDGGNGGRGGRGGSGAHGGNITIGVLKGTLEATVTAKAFKIKDQGGQKGRGGPGGPGGPGGRGGQSGNGEVCHSARNGQNGAQGQPGAVGTDSPLAGNDGQIRLHEFSQAAWDELLTRPWLSSISPTAAFPGATLTLQGSRFTPNDRVIVGSSTLTPSVNADESISVTLPAGIAGGAHTVFVRQADGDESNRLELRIKPQLDVLPAGMAPGATVTLRGNAFLNGASVLVGGAANPAVFKNVTTLEFKMPGTGGTGSVGGAISIQVRNPDGLVSNTRSGTLPRILEIPFKFGVHNLSFPNFTDGVPDWGTFEDTFGTAEVWHEQLDPVFGHPILTAAFFGFYVHFLKGKANGGLATGFCTSLASTVADRFWLGLTDTTTLTKAGLQKPLTAIHGKLLSRESLLSFHDQGREGVARVVKTAREIETVFLRGTDRTNAPLLFFIPSGEVWDSGYFDKLSDSHCVMPWRFVYPQGHPGPQLSVDGSTTVSSLDGVKMFVWDCNQPNSDNCFVQFRMTGGQLCFDYFANSTNVKFKFEDGITLGQMSNGAYRLDDHDLPFSGPFGLTSFIIDFLLSPADLQVTDENGRRTGNFAGKLLSEIPDSRPCYLANGAYMLPVNSALTRKITGTGNGTYSFHSVIPGGGSIAIENVATAAGQVDTLSVNGDATQIRFTPHAEKKFSLTLSRQVGNEVRALAITGAGGGPASEVDITVSPELSVMRLGNRGAARNVDVKAFRLPQRGQAAQRKDFANIALPVNHDLTVAVSDWAAMDVAVQTVSFE